jgi:hypothetical protein
MPLWALGCVASSLIGVLLAKPLLMGFGSIQSEANGLYCIPIWRTFCSVAALFLFNHCLFAWTAAKSASQNDRNIVRNRNMALVETI